MAGNVDVEDHIEQLRSEGSRLAVAVAVAGPDAPVPACPDWVVRDLVLHLGRVHRWATAFVVGGLTRPDEVDFATVGGPPPDDRQLVDWFVEGHGALVDALATAPPDLECWSFLAAPSPRAFWARRQAHELAVHRVDGEQAAGAAVSSIPPALAADGLDELLVGFVPRLRTGGNGESRTEPPSVRIACLDDDAGWLVTLGPERPRTAADHGGDRPEEDGGADCTVRGRAEDVFLTLWNRRGTEPLGIEGDRDVLGSFLGLVRI